MADTLEIVFSILYIESGGFGQQPVNGLLPKQVFRMFAQRDLEKGVPRCEKLFKREPKEETTDE